MSDAEQNPYICCVCHSTADKHCDECRGLCMPTASGDEPSMPNSKSDDTRIEEIFNQYDHDVTGVPFHWERTEESVKALDKAKHAIHRYVQKIVVEELKRLYSGDFEDPMQTLLNEIADRITALEKELGDE